MRCRYCASEIGDEDRFCSFCGCENTPVVRVQQNMPPLQMYRAPVPQPAYRAPAPAAQKKQGGALKWVLVSIWLVLAVVGWIVALLLMPASSGDAAPVAYRQTGDAGLTQTRWYQFDPASGRLFCWEFQEAGAAQYSEAGTDRWYQVTYTTAGEDLVITHGDVSMVWEYDALENCYWHRQGQYRNRIFAADGIPGGTVDNYLYRTDSVAGEFAPITVMNRETAQMLVERYNNYLYFRICTYGQSDSQREADEAMAAVGPREHQDIYSVGKVPCCRTIEQMERHIRHLFGPDMLLPMDMGNVLPVEYGDGIFIFVPAMGMEGYYVKGDPVAQTDGTYTVLLGEGFDEYRDLLAVFAQENGTWKLMNIIPQ